MPSTWPCALPMAFDWVHLKPWLPSLDESPSPPAPHPSAPPCSYTGPTPASPSPKPDSLQAPQPSLCKVPDLHNSHVLRDGGIADSVGSGWDAGFTAVAAPAAVQTGHVHSVKAVMCLPWPWGSLLFPILI